MSGERVAGPMVAMILVFRTNSLPNNGDEPQTLPTGGDLAHRNTKLTRFKAIRKPLRVFLADQLVTTAGLALAVAALAALAGAVDGHGPDPQGVLRAALPGGALGGLAFTLSRWRAQAGDVALAGLGLRPVAIWTLGAGLASAFCGAAPRHETSLAPAQTTLTVSPAELVAVSGGRTVQITFGPVGAVRTDMLTPWPSVPAPTGATEQGVPWTPPPILWLPLACALAIALVVGASAPGLARTLVSLGVILALAWALGL